MRRGTEHAQDRQVDPIEVVVVSTEACELCADAEAALAELATELPLRVRAVAATSEEGRSAIADHRPSMLPLVLLDGAVFSVGRLPRRKLRHVLGGDRT
jgi:hypothetical protein